MPISPWRSPLARALHLNRSLVYSRYLQLATVRTDGRPANRTVVFRGFLDDTNQLKFVTDARSEKTSHIAHQSWAEACWYFPKSREQFRLLGQLVLVQADHAEPSLSKARQMQWQELSDSARVQFAWAHPAQPRAVKSAFDLPVPDPLVPLPNFCLLLLDPVRVDHLELRGDPQDRHIYLREADHEEQWSVQAVNP